MTDRLRLTILGCGSSPGVPRITGDWGNCDPDNPKNRRLRPAAMLERIGTNGTTRVVIDTGPDFREQMIAARVSDLDGVIYTHPHADHIHGIDDLRSYALHKRTLVDIFADAPTMARLHQGFGYCFKTPPGSSYPPILRPHIFKHHEIIEIDGAGGKLCVETLPQVHGDIVSLGLRAGGIAYCTDVSGFEEPTVNKLQDLDYLVIDALQYRRHPSHLSLDEALQWIEKLRPKRAVLTHLHVPLDYDTVMRETPEHVEPAYDGMAIETDLEAGQ